jgi:hypothetical protein
LCDDPDLRNFTQRGVSQLLKEHVLKGNQLEAREVTDEDWLDRHMDDPWVYQTVVSVPEFPRHGLFLKVRLLWDEGDADDEAFVELVSIHKGF